MARIKKHFGEAIGKLSGEVDFYYHHGKPVARSWPRHPKRLHTINQRKAQEAFIKARKAVKNIPTALKAAWTFFFYGKSKAWIDFYTSNFIKYTLRYGRTPPVISGFSIEQDGSDYIISFKTDRCEPHVLYIYRDDIMPFVFPKYVHGKWDICYGENFPQPYLKISSIGCFDFKEVNPPYSIWNSLIKYCVYDKVLSPRPVYKPFQEFLDLIKQQWCRFGGSVGYLHCAVDFNIVDWYYDKKRYYFSYASTGPILQFDKNYFIENEVFKEFPYFAIKIAHKFEPMVYDNQSPQGQICKDFTGVRAWLALHKWPGYYITVFGDKNKLENWNYRVPLAFDLCSFSTKTLFKFLKPGNSRQYRAMMNLEYGKNFWFLAGKKNPYMRYRIPRRFFGPGSWFAFKSVDGAYFIIPPLRGDELLDIATNPAVVSKHSYEHFKPLMLSARPAGDFWSEDIPDDKIEG